MRSLSYSRMLRELKVRAEEFVPFKNAEGAKGVVSAHPFRYIYINEETYRYHLYCIFCDSDFFFFNARTIYAR
jgi:hypothetical protein